MRLALELYAVETLASRGGSREGLALLGEFLGGRAQHAGEPQGRGSGGARYNFARVLVALVGNETLLRNVKAINERLVVFRMIDFASLTAWKAPAPSISILSSGSRQRTSRALGRRSG